MSTEQGAFELLPAIDLRGGQVVRLEQGDFARETAYDGDPVAVARAVRGDRRRPGSTSSTSTARGRGSRASWRSPRRSWPRRSAGHGSRSAAGCGPRRTSPARSASVPRGRPSARPRSATRRSPSELVDRYGPSRIVGSIDIRDGLALGEGWRPGAAGVPATDAIGMLADAGIDTFEVTAIERDGSLEGPDLALLRSLVALERGRIIASGGVASIEDVLAVQAAGCAGAIVGKAIYEGRIDLRSLLEALDGPGGLSRHATRRRRPAARPRCR